LLQFDASPYLPLTEATYYTMLCLVEPRHGYGIMREVGRISEGAVRLGPGTLYGALAALEKQGLIARDRQEGRRKNYILTLKGRLVLAAQIARLETMVKNARNVRTKL
jgi:DNA-binding PadR family transcriptional regulator